MTDTVPVLVAGDVRGVAATTPAVATVVATGATVRLTEEERMYVGTMKRRERDHVLKRLSSDAKRAAYDDAMPIRIRILQSTLPDAVRTQLFDDLGGDASCKMLAWARCALALPRNILCAPRFMHAPSMGDALNDAMRVMDALVVGHDVVKQEVLKVICQTWKGAPPHAGYALGLEGPPGTGKTHFVRHAMATALDRPLLSLQLGGAADVSYLLGQMYTYEGSTPGRLAAGLIECGVCNPIVYLDEVDKISESERGRELVAVLIHLLDPTSNNAIRDRYLHGIDIDFSRCLFVLSYNDPSRVHPVLLDRIRRVRVSSPTMDERMHIVANIIIPRATRRLHANDVTFDSRAVQAVVARGVFRGDGVRGCERDVEDLISHVQLACARNRTTRTACVTEADVRGMLSDVPSADIAPPPPGMYR